MTEESVPGQWQALTLAGVLRLTEDLDVPKNVPFRWPPAELEEKGQGDHQEAWKWPWYSASNQTILSRTFYPGAREEGCHSGLSSRKGSPWPGSTIRLFPFLDPQRGGSSC